MVNRPLALHSPGWLDYYDHWFEQKGPGVPVWNRNGRVFPSRREGLAVMAEAGVLTVPHGAVAALAALHPESRLVVYTDEREHQGLGKELLPAAQAADRFPGMLASLYLAPTGAALCLRLLRVGVRGFALRYEGGSDWRSNHGTESIELIESPLLARYREAMSALMRRYRSPLLAIDLVPREGEWFATDFNLAPGMRGAGLSEVLPSREAVAVIKDDYFAYCAA